MRSSGRTYCGSASIYGGPPSGRGTRRGLYGRGWRKAVVAVVFPVWGLVCLNPGNANGADACGGKIAGSWDVTANVVFPATLVMPAHQSFKWEFKSDRPSGGSASLHGGEQPCQGNSYAIDNYYGITLTLSPDGRRLDGGCGDLFSAAGGGCRIHAVRISGPTIVGPAISESTSRLPQAADGAVLKSTPALSAAERRIALLIGNQRYTDKVGPLRNPHSDIALVETALRKVGFEVTALRDADYRSMDLAIKRYISKVRDTGSDAVSFFYYSGHGVANPTTRINYLIPVDVADTDTEDLWYQSIELSEIIDKLGAQAPNATHYVVFDACRDELKLKQTGKTLGSTKGFVPIFNASGLLIAYSTAPNKTASDIGVGSGPYAKALAEEITRPGQEAVTMFRNVQLKVKKAIGQDPWLSFPTLRPVYFAGEQVP
jgi:hypothetical protein